MLKFEVKNLGKIRTAEIETAKLVLFVGRNNTGKSYLATLMWSLYQIGTLIPNTGTLDHWPEWFKKFAKPGGRKSRSRKVTEKHADEIIRLVNKSLEGTLGASLADVFAYDSFEKTHLTIEKCAPFEPFTIGITQRDMGEQDRPFPVAAVSITETPEHTSYRMNLPIGSKLQEERLYRRVYVELLGRIIHGPGWANIRTPLYIPAARTGLMLAMGALVARLFETDDGLPIDLPRPLRNFLQRMSLPRAIRSSRATSAARVAAWLEEEVVHGSIETIDEEVPSFVYMPDGTSTPVPLHAASSMITELAPFLVLLKSRMSGGQIIFEEPEAHLHISAQRAMARALARLINAGFQVLVTTHSDTFVQQINNLISLHTAFSDDHNIERLGYDRKDLIDPISVKAYEFVEQDGFTRVNEVEKTEHGLVVNSLNETLSDLADETISIHGLEND